MRRSVLLAIILLGSCSPAGAAVPAHTTKPLLPVQPRVESFASLQAYPRTLVELDRLRAAEAEPALRRAGGEQIAAPLALWRLPSWSAEGLLPGLQRRGLVRSVTPDVPVGTNSGSARGLFSQFTDPLSPTEWWVSHVGADRWTTPGPGVPVTLIDSGVDMTHEEFASRPNTVRLNAQTVSASEDEAHGTATASVLGAPVNGLGLVGIYPQAKLQLWDASRYGQLTVGDEIAGLFAARRAGRGVINLSLGGFDRIAIEEHAIMSVFRSGLLVVASVGNDREGRSGLSYPATFPHVLTVGATNEADHVTFFSSASPAVDLAAPGQNIQAAIPRLWDPIDGYELVDGTSFSAPLVSGAAAAVWTVRPTLANTQLFQIMRRSARDVGRRGWDADTGYGILNLPAAVSRRAPASDPQEPNEDIYLVKPNGLTRAGNAPLTRRARPRVALKASLERREDPEDVYRAFLPARGRLVVTVRPSANVTLELWGRRTRTVFERGPAARRDLLGLSAHRGRRFERITLRGRGVGQYVYVDVFLPRGGVQASYTLSVAPAAH